MQTNYQNLKSINDADLMTRTEVLVKDEREILVQVLRHLNEIERRRLYSAYGYKSLFDFARRHLGYSEDATYRRIDAMKVLNELPELEEKLNLGKITLSHIGVAQSFFRNEAKSSESAESNHWENSDHQKSTGQSNDRQDKDGGSHGGTATDSIQSPSQGFSRDEKINLYEKMEHTSVREARRIALSLSSVPHQAQESR